MVEDLEDSYAVLIGGIIFFALTWCLFEVVIQPALVSLSPIFADQALHSTGRVGRVPDNLAQVALFATLLLGIFTYYILLTLISSDGDDNESIGTIEGLYTLFIVIPLGVIKTDILPKLKFWDGS